jgi:hypothetical protein
MTTASAHTAARNRPSHLAQTDRTTLHLVDVENLAGDAYPTTDRALAVLHDYATSAGHCDGDLAFLAANRHLLHSIVFDLPFACRPSTASGPDGADLALLDAAPPAWVCRRFDRLVIGSGDHVFAELAEAALAAGLEVAILTRPGSVARIYFELGCEVRFLGAPEITALPTGRGTRFAEAADDVA